MASPEEDTRDRNNFFESFLIVLTGEYARLKKLFYKIDESFIKVVGRENMIKI